MKTSWIALPAALLLAACAGQPPAGPPAVERMTAAQLAAALPQPAANVGLDDIVALSRQGVPPAAIIAKVKASHSRYRLSASQVLDLHAKGVAAEVLDALVEGERQAVFDDMAGELAKREEVCRDALQQELSLCRLQCFNGWPGLPYGDCWPPRPGYPYWRCF